MKRKLVRVTRLERRGVPGVLLQAPSDRDFATQVNQHVPWDHRWRIETKAGWWISDAYADVAIHLARERFTSADFVGADGAQLVLTAAGEKCRQESLF